MRDEITRLADQMDRDAAGCERDGYNDAAIAKRDCAIQLRALARTDHPEIILGMVPEDVAEEIVESIGQTVGVSHGGWDDVDEIELCRAFHAEFVTRGMLASAPAPEHSAADCIAAMSRMKDAAMVAHKLCYEAMLKHPDVDTLGDDGELHKAIHAIVGVDTPNYVASPDHSAGVGGMVPEHDALITAIRAQIEAAEKLILHARL